MSTIRLAGGRVTACATLPVAIALFACSGLAFGQYVTAGAGVAVPHGPMAVRRVPGAQFSLAISPAYRTSGRTVRAEITGSWFARRDAYAATPHGREEGTLSMASALVYVVFMAGADVVSPHVGFGAGVSRMRIPGRTNPYGNVVEVAALLGARIGTGRVQGLIEVQHHLLATDYGVGDYESSRFTPLRVGISVRGR